LRINDNKIGRKIAEQTNDLIRKRSEIAMLAEFVERLYACNEAVSFNDGWNNCVSEYDEL